MKKYTFLLLSAFFALAVQSRASLVTSLPGGTVITLPGIDYFGPGPIAVGSGITWSSTNASNQGGSVFGYSSGYGFGGNGFWDSGVGSIAGVNDAFNVYGVSDTMTFTLSTPVSGIGGFLNYVPGGSTPTTIAVYNSVGGLIESSALNFSTGGATDAGAFYGFLESSADISSFTLTDNYIAVTNLTTSNATPEPSFYGVMALGLGLLVAMSVRRRRSSAANLG